MTTQGPGAGPSRALGALVSLPRLGLIGLIRGYQVFVSPLLGPRCRYYPSCSSYGLGAVTTHGAIKGSVLAAWRVLRCNPWNWGGVDDVPPAGTPLWTALTHRTHSHTHVGQSA